MTTTKCWTRLQWPSVSSSCTDKDAWQIFSTWRTRNNRRSPLKRTLNLSSVLIALTFFLVACSGSQRDSEDVALSSAQSTPVTVVVPSATSPATETPTQVPTNTPVPPTATPVPTPTPVALGDIDLEALLIRPNDLPPGFAGAQVSDILPAKYRHAPDADAHMFQALEAQGEPSGGVAVLLYASPSRLEAAYRLLEADLGDPKYEPSNKVTRETVEGIGEYAIGSVMSNRMLGINLDRSSLLVVKCHALIEIWMNTSDLRSLKAYGSRLEQRLQPYICDTAADDWKPFSVVAGDARLSEPVYALMTLGYIGDLQESLDTFFELVYAGDQNRSLVTDQTWLFELMSAGSNLGGSADLIARLNPPARFQEFHGNLLEAAELLGRYGNVVAAGAMGRNPTALTETIQDLFDGKAKFDELLNQLDALHQAAAG